MITFICRKYTFVQINKVYPIDRKVIKKMTKIIPPSGNGRKVENIYSLAISKYGNSTMLLRNIVNQQNKC